MIMMRTGMVHRLGNRAWMDSLNTWLIVSSSSALWSKSLMNPATLLVSERLLEGRKLEFYTWVKAAEELLKNVREKLNMLGEHWSRDEKNKCLREATKSFRFLEQIVRLIIL
ncbi:unnamed protein product [Citrullus colocynthis]|uniref:Uncharacterized protein n=1 Tax=Citrullus colocynthis TaxID=252529 RepID=A0ABP0Y9L9_9ROSI